VFLKDCLAYAAAARQEAFAVVCASMDDTTRAGYEFLLERIVSEEPDKWKACVKAFMMVTGRDISSPQEEAYAQLDRGRIRQERHESVLDYGNRIRILHMRSGSVMPAHAVCSRFTDGLWPPVLKRECAYPPHGGRWDDLNACISYAVTRARIFEKTHSAPRQASVAAFARPGQQGKTRPFTPQAATRGGAIAKRPRTDAPRTPTPPPPPPPQHAGPSRSARPLVYPLEEFPGRCNECGQWGHKASSHTPLAQRKKRAAAPVSVQQDGAQ